MIFENFGIIVLRDVDDYKAEDEIFIIDRETLKQADEIDAHWYEYAEDDSYEFSFDIEKYMQDEKTNISKYNALYNFLSAKECRTHFSKMYEC